MDLRKLIRSADSKRQEPATRLPRPRFQDSETAGRSNDDPVESSSSSISRSFKRMLSIPAKIFSGIKTTDNNFEDRQTKPPAQRYVLLKYLGHECNGTINLSRDVKTEDLVAIKTVLHKEPNTVPSEVAILQHIGPHENIVQLLNCFDHPSMEDWTRIVFEHCEIGDLHEYSCQMGSTPPPEPFLWHIKSEISRGLEFIHSKNVVHGDLKLSNVLLRHPPGLDPESQSSRPRFPVLEIADFGNSVLKPRSDIPQSHLSTWCYCAPESGEYFGPETDIWALGCIIHQLGHRKFPYTRISNAEYQPEDEKAYESSDWSNDLKEFYTYLRTRTFAPTRLDQPTPHSMPRSKLLQYFMMRTLETDHKKRITASELCRYVTTIAHLIRKIVPKDETRPVTYMSTKQYRPILASFDESEGVTDSSVVREVFCTFMEYVAMYEQDWLFVHVAQLLPLLGKEDEKIAIEVVKELSLVAPGMHAFQS